MDHVTYYVRFYLIEIKYCLQNSGYCWLPGTRQELFQNVLTVDCTDAVGLATNIGHFRVLEVNLITGRRQPPSLPPHQVGQEQSRQQSRNGVDIKL